MFSNLKQMRWRTTANLCLATAVVLLGCSAKDPEQESATTAQSSEGLSIQPEGLGFIHTAAHSKFRIGTSTAGRSEFGMDKFVGPEGVFATVTTSGWAMGIPNSDAPSRFAGALSTSPDVHNKAVRDYFVGAGLPADQIGSINAHATMHVSSTDGDVSKPVFDSFSSVISRSIDGIPVSDSFAVAEFNVNGDVVEESVYWPNVPSNVIDDARALRARLDDASGRAAFMAILPGKLSEGAVIIRHSSGAIGTEFEAAASYDVNEAVAGGLFRVRHFSPDGHEFKMRNEQMTEQGNVAPKK